MEKSTFKYYGPYLWNLVPIDITKCMDLDTFKTLLMSWDRPICQCNYVMFYHNVPCKYLYIL